MNEFGLSQRKVQWLNELELELVQSHMVQKPVLRGEVGCACVAREVSVEMMERRTQRKFEWTKLTAVLAEVGRAASPVWCWR